MTKQIIEKMRAKYIEMRDMALLDSKLRYGRDTMIWVCDEILEEIKPCVWTLGDHGYDVGCGLNTNLPAQYRNRKMKFCPHCGMEIEEAGK